jgi:uncharacterized protein YegP (UPF0339 family)
MSTFETYRAKDGHRWRFWSTNLNILADSGEAYSREADRDHGIWLCKNELVTYKIHSSGSQYYWNAKSSNGNIIADSAERYWNLKDCETALATFRRECPTAPVIKKAA